MLHTENCNFLRINCTPYFRKKCPADKHGTIYIRVTCERKNTYHNVYEYIHEKHWNADKHCIRRSYPNYNLLNDVIEKELQKIKALILTNKLKGNEINHIIIKELVHEKISFVTLQKVFSDYVVFNAVPTRRASAFTVVLRHCTENAVPGNVAAIKEGHLVTLKNALAKKTKPNTTLSILKKLKAVLNFAVKKGVIEKNPMQGIKLGAWQNKKDFLSESDILLIAAKSEQYNPSQSAVAAMFIFCCYTGLRFGDANNIDKKNIVDTENGTAILFADKKTKTQQLMPLLPQAINLLPLVLGKQYSNQYYNRTLKEIAAIAGINKPVTSHIARHTFATLGVSKGIKLEVMQALLGHSSIKTTQGYAKLMDITKWEEIAKWK